MSDTDLDVLIVQRIADLDDAAKRLTRLEERMGRAMCAVAEAWVEEQGWVGSYKWPHDLSVAPAHWRPEEDAWRAWFSLHLAHGDSGAGVGDEDYFTMTRLLGKGQRTYTLRFDQDTYNKSLIKNISRRIAGRFTGTGFLLDEGSSFVLPFTIDAEDFVDAIRGGDLSDGLAGYREALNRLPEAISHFDDLLALAAQEVARKA